MEEKVEDAAKQFTLETFDWSMCPKLQAQGALELCHLPTAQQSQETPWSKDNLHPCPPLS